MSPKGNYKRNTHYTDRKTIKSIKNREGTKKWLPVQFTTFTVSYTYIKSLEKLYKLNKENLSLFRLILASANIVLSRKYAMCVARV